MSTRVKTVSSRLGEPFSTFVSRVNGALFNAGEIQVINFNLTKRESSRYSGFTATITYQDDGGCRYSVFGTLGTPAEVEEAVNSEFRLNIYRRARFVRAATLTRRRQISIGLLALVATTPEESGLGRQFVHYGHVNRNTDGNGQIPAGGTAIMNVLNRFGNIPRDWAMTVEVENRAPIASYIGKRSVLLWRDPLSPGKRFYFYPNCNR